jgi:ABC-2 type transport system permease protein
VKTYKLKKTSKVQVIADATDPNIANTITNYVNAILQNRAQEINKANLPAYQIQTQTQLYYNPELKVFYLCAWRDDGHLDVSISNDDFYIHHP